MTRKKTDPISNVTVFEAQWTDTPEDVYEEVRRLWAYMELGNDYFYYPWSKEDAESYPLIGAFLASRGIDNCLIHWWW